MCLPSPPPSLPSLPSLTALLCSCKVITDEGEVSPGFGGDVDGDWVSDHGARDHQAWSAFGSAYSTGAAGNPTGSQGLFHSTNKSFAPTRRARAFSF